MSDPARPNDVAGINVRTDTSAPTIVLVHGAFADSSSWAAVISRLHSQGYPTLAVANPLRGLTSDSDYTRSVLATIAGPVVLVGHAYGGAVITNAAVGNPRVDALVYLSAFALDDGESVVGALALGGRSELPDHLIMRSVPGEVEAEAYLDPVHFHRLFAQDLALDHAAWLASAQRPASLATLGTPSGQAAWRSIPSWYLLASRDNIIPPVAQHAMARRAGATTVEINSSHAVMLSHPERVAEIVMAAADAVSRSVIDDERAG
ncbi:alpha/beta fold hydrolase [Salinibacterium hongtaonis]|uniref:alpha/beta fold hydrolase n=1 Tax=Homoserinimonas hongtaonis TaxID=2079791 RepID=UPI000D39D3B6|nr:alpha/beta hydrolase [Salinibacterium hongtaonis]AWB89567.1 alpha/beta hydrolase [Salinibacterium hongtaonis]